MTARWGTVTAAVRVVEHQARIDELAGPQPLVGVLEVALRRSVPVAVSIWLSIRVSLPVDSRVLSSLA